MMALAATRAPTELERDNATRLAIFDALKNAEAEGKEAVTLNELHARVIGDLRTLVPRELYIACEQSYLAEKVSLYVKDGILKEVSGEDEDHYGLAPDAQLLIRYPDGNIKSYTHGLSAARKRIDAANAVLRETGFDITEHLPHLEPYDPKYRALVRSIEEHGFLRQCEILRYPDGKIIDGVSRQRAAAEAGTKPRYREVEKLPRSTRATITRRDTPLTRVLLTLDINASRLSEEQHETVLNTVAEIVGRDWKAIQADLDLTQAWRRSIGSTTYTPDFDVEEIEPRDRPGSAVLVTADRKVAVLSLLRAYGLKSYDGNASGVLPHYVAMEYARPMLRVEDQRKPQTKQNFAPAADLLAGITAMLDERERPRDRAAWLAAAAWLEVYLST